MNIHGLLYSSIHQPFIKITGMTSKVRMNQNEDGINSIFLKLKPFKKRARITGKKITDAKAENICRILQKDLNFIATGVLFPSMSIKNTGFGKVREICFFDCMSLPPSLT